MTSIKKLTKLAKKHFEDGEDVIALVDGGYETKVLGKNSLRRGILIATNKRIVFYGKKMFGYNLELLPYSNISSIETGKKIFGSLY